ncbi:MAG: S41 family peptidase [Pseudomonadota bacterium]
MKITKMLALGISVFCFLISQSAFSLTDKGFEKLYLFTKSLKYLEDHYVEEVDEEALVEGAISGMLDTLDPHSSYLSPEVYKELKAGTGGKFDGIGVEVAVRNKQLTVIAPLKGSPAEKAGLKTGDIILRIDNENTRNMSLQESARMMRGKRGTNLKLTIAREGVKKPFDVNVTRQKIVVESVTWERIDDYGIITVASFQDGTSQDVRKALKSLQKDKPIKGLILDLRRNPGGLLQESVKVSGIFLNSGVIVTSSARGKEIDKRVATPENTEPDYPMIILIDGGSASASEIVAGALQDNKRAVILGERSFGKGSLQTVFDLDDGSALKITVAKYYTPSGRSIQALGIEPDIDVPAYSPETIKRRHLRESDLSQHLDAEAGEAHTKKIELTDHQKEVALAYLKSWGVFMKDQKAQKKDKNTKNNNKKMKQSDAIK